MNDTLKKCPSCGKFFTCKGTDDCWCENYQIHRKEYLQILQQYDDCICSHCLSIFSE